VADQTLVSVVMAVHNGADHLLSTLRSILAQQQVNLECIVVNDGSSDASPGILKEFSASDERLRVIDVKHAGLTRALVHGCAMAQGKFIARHDVGDLSEPNRFRAQQDMLQGSPDMAFVACQTVRVGPNDELLSEVEPADGGEHIIRSLTSTPPVDMRGPHHGSVMFRRSAYEQVGGYRSEFYFAQDLDLWSRLIEVGQLEFVKQALYRERIVPDSISSRNRASQLALKALIMEATKQRRCGESESDVLLRAATIQPGSDVANRNTEADAYYFIGSCLYARGDTSAAGYFRKVIRSNPLNIKAWVKLTSGWLRYSR
jgi:glycosyltransferase involved in cell wall biosynthesis